MLSLLDRVCVGYSKAGLWLASKGVAVVVAYWVAQVAAMVALYVYTDMFWYVMIGWNIIAAVMMWRANAIDTASYVDRQVAAFSATWSQANYDAIKAFNDEFEAGRA